MNNEREIILDGVLEAIESGHSDRIESLTIFAGPDKRPAMEAAPWVWEHIAQVLMGKSAECKTCEQLLKAMLATWPMHVIQEPEGWIVRWEREGEQPK